jgi:stage III sporulation protein AF
MAGFLENWIRGLAAAAILAAVMLICTPKGSVRQVVKLVCGALLTFVLLSPLKELNIDRLSEFISKARYDGRQLAASAENESELIMKLIIEDETAAYILDKASKLGIVEPEVKVTVKEGESCPYPYSVEISCNASEGLKDELSSLIEGELGIPRDRQIWNTALTD